MTSKFLFLPLALTAALVSCAPDVSPTSSYVAPSPEMPLAAPTTDPAATGNPVYDTPAAYEETSAATQAESAAIPTTLPDPSPSAVVTPSPRPASINGAAIIHTVVAGDTLSGISKKYKVPSAAIKAANRMTNDTVVLGKKMAIPPAN